MDVSAKIPEEGMATVLNIQAMLIKRGIRASKRDVLGAAIKAAAEYPEKIAAEFNGKGDSTAAALEKYLNAKVRFSGDLIEEHDTVF